MKPLIVALLLFSQSINVISQQKMSLREPELQDEYHPGRGALIIAGLVYAFGVNVAIQQKAQSGSGDQFLKPLNACMIVSGAFVVTAVIEINRNQSRKSGRLYTQH